MKQNNTTNPKTAEAVAKGMTCYILKDASQKADCSLDGISNRYTEVLLIGENIPKIFEADGDLPVVRIENHYKHYVRAVPVNAKHDDEMMAMGGCFIWTTDSRFPADYPVPLHDRDMTKEKAGVAK